MVIFFFLGIVLFVLALGLPEHEGKIKGWLIAIGALLWAIGGSPPA